MYILQEISYSMRLQTLHTLVLLFCLQATIAQQRYFGHYGRLEGLPQETILCINNDSSGFLWLGTSAGMVRYDGTDFFVPPEDTASGYDISGLRVGALLVERDIIYVATGQKGILAYDIRKMSTSQIGHQNSDCSALASTSLGILAGYYDKGLGFVNKDGEFEAVRFRESVPKRITAIKEFNNHIYLGTDEGLLLRFPTTDLTKNQSISLETIQQLEAGITRLTSKGKDLIISSGNGLYGLENQTLFPIAIKSPDNLDKNFAVVDHIDVAKKTFIATTAGLLEGSWIGKDTFQYQQHHKAGVKYDPFSLNRDGINDIHVYDGVLSVGHNSLDQTTITNHNVFQSVVAKYNLGNPSVFAILETDTQLWIGTTSGLLITDKASERYIHYPGLRSRSIIDDSKGSIWVGTGENILIFEKNSFDYDRPRFQTMRELKSDKAVIANPNIRSIYKDNSKQMWVVTYNMGVYKLREHKNNNELYFDAYFTGEDATKIPSPFTININQDLDNNYWLTTQKGLSKLSFQASRLTVKNYSEQDGLAASGVLSTFVDSGGNLWVATRKGLSKYEKEQDQFISYNKRDGLSNTFVYNILEDNDNKLWLSTNGGLFRFDPSTSFFANYTPKDGLQSIEFNLGAAYKNTDGMLYFGGIAGLNKFDPSRIGLLDKQSLIQFTSIKSQETQLLSSLEKQTTLKTAYNTFPLSFSFAARDYRPSKNIQYQYRLLPDNTTWNDLGAKNNIQLLSLGSGNHTLQIQGLSRGIAWSQEPLQLDITITPPWYKSSLAYFVYLLLFLTGVYIYYKIALQRKLAGQEAKRLQDLDDLKSRFITNITHEFRTPLTVILGYVQNLKPKLKKTAIASDELLTIEKNSENLLGLVNQMLDLAKLEQGRLKVTYYKNDIAAYAKVLLESFESYALEKEINLHFHSSLQDPNLDYDEEKLRQILTNLVSNAIKFTENKGSVTVALTENENNLNIEVQDTGSGIPAEDLPQIFDRFYQVENNSFKVSQGTGIGLALTKELTQLMNGSITVKSILNEGTTFRITLPISRKATYKEITIPKSNVITQHIYVPEKESVSVPEDAPLILVVEDNKDMSRYIVSCLQENYNIEVAYNGKKGLEKALEITPDIVLSDVMMPEMDGFEMTRQLQGLEATNHIPVVLLTSKALQEDKMEGLESGAEAYLNKPFQKAELLLRLEKLIAKRRLLQSKYRVTDLLEPKKALTQKLPDKNRIFLEKAISLIEKELENPEFTPSRLAQELALSDSQLYRKLKAITNTSTALFMRGVRLEKAKGLLLTTDKTISEIAYETGFTDPNWFGKAFKEQFETTPSVFRKSSNNGV